MKLAVRASALLSLGLAQAATFGRTPVDLKPRHATILPSDDHGTMAALFGSEVARDRFFQYHFGSDIVHMKRSDAELPPPVEVGEVDLLTLFKRNEMWVRNWGSLEQLDKKDLKFEDFAERIDNGESVVAKILGDDRFLPLKKHVEESFGLPVSMNVYHSGPQGVALAPHTDEYDVIVLHLEGEKEWEICVPDDLNRAGVEGMSAADISDIKEVEMENVRGCTTHEDEARSLMSCSNMTMVPGDTLYLPKGVVHSATAGDEKTTHITIGLKRDDFKYFDFLQSMLHSNDDLLSSKLTDDSDPDETVSALVNAVLHEILATGEDAFGLGLRRMMPSWIWRNYQGCTATHSSIGCDPELFGASTTFLVNSMLGMINNLQVAVARRIYESNSLEVSTHHKDNETAEDLEPKDLLAGKSSWLVELNVEASLENLKQMDLVTASVDLHLARMQARQTMEKTKNRQDRVEGANIVEKKMEVDRVWSETAFNLITELSSGKYPEYDRVVELANAEVVDELALFEAHRELSTSALCVAACDAVEFACNLGCDAISLGADVCKIACDGVFILCAGLFLTESCDAAPCFSSCDAGPCFSSCDNNILCVSSCDDGCIGGCDGWLGIGSCDSRCAFGCDSSCVASSCDSSCTLGCDGSCILGCDQFNSLADPCFDAQSACHSACDEAEDLANECRTFCETDLNSCSVMCGFVDQAIDAAAAEIDAFFDEALDFFDSVVDAIQDALDAALVILNEIAGAIEDAYNAVDSGFSTITTNTELSLEEGIVTDILDAFILVVGIQLAPYCSLMAIFSFVGVAGMNASFGLTLGLNTFTVTLWYISEDANLFSDKALVIEACLGFLIGAPGASLSFGIGYAISFEDVMTYEDMALWGSDVPPAVDLGQSISISTNFLAFFGFPVVFGGSVGWNLATETGSYINPFNTIPNSAGFFVLVEAGSKTFDPTGLISIEYAVCGGFGRVASSPLARKLEEEGSVVVRGREYTDADELKDEYMEFGLRKMRRLQGNSAGNANENQGGNNDNPNSNAGGNSAANSNGIGNGGREAFENIKNERGQFRGNPRASANEPETAEEHISGKGPFDRTVLSEPEYVPTMAEIDNHNMQRYVDQYNAYFRGVGTIPDVPLSEYIETLSVEELELLYESLGGSPDTIEGEVVGF